MKSVDGKMVCKLYWFFIISMFFMISCSSEPPIEGKVVVSEQEFSMRKDGITWVTDVKGKIKNIGDVDVKAVTVAGFCDDCGDVVSPRVWYVASYDREEYQKDTISYITVGAEEEFHFKEISYFYDSSGIQPREMPELECRVVSF